MTSDPQEGNNTEFQAGVKRLRESINKASDALMASSCAATFTNNTYGTGSNTWGGSGPAPLYGGYATTSGTITGPLGAQLPALQCTHVADNDVTWMEGSTIHLTCGICGVDFQLTELPGGVSMLKVRALLGGALMLQEGCDVALLSEVLGIYAELRATIEKEEAALEQQRNMLELAGQMLTKKVAEG